MLNRRKFVQSSFLSSAALFFNKTLFASDVSGSIKNNPVVISTWGDNVKANAEAWNILGANGRALDAVEAGVQIPEALGRAL